MEATILEGILLREDRNSVLLQKKEGELWLFKSDASRIMRFEGRKRCGSRSMRMLNSPGDEGEYKDAYSGHPAASMTHRQLDSHLLTAPALPTM